MNSIQIILFCFVVLQIKALTCGGNCPSDTCTECWCGLETKIVSIADECKKYSWNQNCCQCIMGR